MRMGLLMGKPKFSVCGGVVEMLKHPRRGVPDRGFDPEGWYQGNAVP
jgi:hypothetical protein